ncbi:MAG: tRNA pseudouridine(13) synthase TruD, partial [Acidobacteria bacterium]|nr:tRNA pseudouridine(13) synthase TruD [Acidobacteriota bacterium]
MKLKVNPEDFVVEEIATLPLQSKRGPFRVYQLRKTNWDTFELVVRLARVFGCARRDFAVGGYKDRYGQSSQLLTVRDRPNLPERYEESHMAVEFLGYTPRPISARDITGNHFHLTLRSLSLDETATIARNLDDVRHSGFPNYYDDQRFGSARHGRGFMGKEIFLGNREAALRLYFEPSRFDPSRERHLKSEVIRRWGRWQELAPQAYGDYKRILDFLSQDGFGRSYTRALSLLTKDYLLFVINAYQSYLFNEITRAYLLALQRQHGLDLLTVPYLAGEFIFPARLPEDLARRLAGETLPVLAYDSVFRHREIGEIVNGVLRREGIELAQLRIRKLPGLHVHAKERELLVIPGNLTATAPEADDQYANRQKMTLRFFLP